MPTLLEVEVAVLVGRVGVVDEPGYVERRVGGDGLELLGVVPHDGDVGSLRLTLQKFWISCKMWIEN